MGCVSSTPDAYNKLSQTPQFRGWLRKFEALCITHGEVKKLYKTFAAADADGGGTIDLVELLTVIDLERTPFTERIFCIFDDDNSGKIDFGEFVLALWNYCTLSKITLGMFAFDLYDRDATGILEDYDLEKMMHDIYGKNAATSHYAKQVLVDLVELHHGGEVDLPRFLEFTRTHHSLLFPAFQLQLALKKSLLGVAFWERHAERRVKISKNTYIKIKDLLTLHAVNKIETIQNQAQGEIAKLALETSGAKADKRRKSHTAAQLIVEAKKAASTLSNADTAYRDRFFNTHVSDMSHQDVQTLPGAAGHSDKQERSSRIAARHQRRSFDDSSATHHLSALADDHSASSVVTASTLTSLVQNKLVDDSASAAVQPKRRKSVATAVHPSHAMVLEDVDDRVAHGKSMPSLRTKPSSMSGAATGASHGVSEGPVHMSKGKRRGSAASFIVNNSNNGLHTNDAEQIQHIAKHVAELHDMAHELDLSRLPTLDTGLTGGRGGAPGEFHTRPKPMRRGSV